MRIVHSKNITTVLHHWKMEQSIVALLCLDPEKYRAISIKSLHLLSILAKSKDCSEEILHCDGLLGSLQTLGRSDDSVMRAFTIRLVCCLFQAPELEELVMDSVEYVSLVLQLIAGCDDKNLLLMLLSTLDELTYHCDNAIHFCAAEPRLVHVVLQRATSFDDATDLRLASLALICNLATNAHLDPKILVCVGRAAIGKWHGSTTFFID